MTLRPRSNETLWRLREWSNSKADAERLATQILTHEGYRVWPSHPEGGPDGKADGIVQKLGEPDAQRGVMAVYFPSGQKSWATIKRKLLDDADGVALNDASYLVFVTNQTISRSERAEAATALSMPLELLHIEELIRVLDQPVMAPVRLQYLGISTVAANGEP
jgi:hypothetical protein